MKIDVPGNAWINSSMVPAVGGTQLFVNAYLRSNMRGVGLDVHEYDRQGGWLRVTTGPSYDPVGWSYRSYLHAAGSFSVRLGQDTRHVIVAARAQTGTELPAYLDVDAVSASLR